MLALSVLDLLFKAAEHQREIDEARLEIKAAGPMIVFHEQVQETQLVKTPRS